MPTNAEIEKDQYEKINDLTKKVASLPSAVDIPNQVNIELLKLLKRVMCGAFIIILILLGALIFGAIGKEGLFAVRQTLPLNLPGDQTTDAIPWHNDLDNWLNAFRQAV